MPTPTPRFERPPLEEMGMGVQFEPLTNFHAVHFGLFWTRVQATYPRTEEQAPVFAAMEEPEYKPGPPTASPIITYAVPPLPRCWFLTDDKTELIQVQRDRFVRNWRRVEGGEQYPHYDHISQDFKRDWKKFLAFAEEQNLGPVRTNQCELVYVNNIERGSAWTELGELDGVFPVLCAQPPKAFLPPAEMLSWQARYKLPDERGRLHIEMAPGFRGRDMTIVLSFRLIARGAPVDGSIEQITAWFDLAHEWVLRAFAELTGPRVHELWGMKS